MGREYSQEFHTATVRTTVKGSFAGVSLCGMQRRCFASQKESADDVMTWRERHGAGSETVWTLFGWASERVTGIRIRNGSH
jgi:hypothetical protein